LLYVKDIMTPEVKTANRQTTIRDAAKRMMQVKIGSLVIVENEKPVGIFTEGDVSRAVGLGLDPEKTTIGSLSKKSVLAIAPEKRVEEAAKLMADANIKRLPVVEKGKLVGIVTQTDIVASSFDLVTTLKEMVMARYRPPDFQP
jgi:CBS domain-containing protein